MDPNDPKKVKQEPQHFICLGCRVDKGNGVVKDTKSQFPNNETAQMFADPISPGVLTQSEQSEATNWMFVRLRRLCVCISRACVHAW